MRANGWRIMRFSNEDVYKNLYGVLEAIFTVVIGDVPPPPRSAAPSSAPPPLRGGGKE